MRVFHSPDHIRHFPKTFIARGQVHWTAALIMMGGAMAGGYGGARLARTIGRARARAAVVVIGLLVTGVLLARQLGWLS